MSDPKPTDLLLDESRTLTKDLPLNSFFYLAPNGVDTRVYKLVRKVLSEQHYDEYHITYEDLDKGKRYGSVWKGTKSLRRAYTARQAVSEGKVVVIKDYLSTIKDHPHKVREGVPTEYLKNYLNKVDTVCEDWPIKSDVLALQSSTNTPTNIKKENNMNTNKLNSVVSMAQAQRNMFVVALAQFEEGGKEYHFKLPSTLKCVVKEGDYVVVENRNGSWNKAVVKVTEVKTHADLPYDQHDGPWAWVIAKVGVNAFTIMKENESRTIKDIKARAARQRILDDVDVSITDALNALDNS